MKNRKVATGIALFVVLGVALMIASLRHRSTRQGISDPRRVAYAYENDLISRDLAGRALMDEGSLIDLIGNLSERPFWTDVLTLTDEQKKSLKSLNDIVSEAHRLSWLADASPYDGNPADRYPQITANDKRREDAIAQAQRMVTSGILDDSQAAFVTQRYLAAVGFNCLYDDNNFEYLGLDPPQKRDLAKVLTEYTGAGATRRLHNGLMRNFNEAVRGTLTAAQLKRWDDLTTERPPPEAPSPQARPPAPVFEAAAVEARKASPTLRALVQYSGALGLSAEQKRLLKGLEGIVGQCLTWIALDEERVTRSGASQQNQADRTARARSEFLNHAERYITLGILTEDQANQVAKVIEPKFAVTIVRRGRR